MTFLCMDCIFSSYSNCRAYGAEKNLSRMNCEGDYKIHFNDKIGKTAVRRLVDGTDPTLNLTAAQSIRRAVMKFKMHSYKKERSD